MANSISGISQGISMLAVPWYFTGIIHREELFGKVYFFITSISLLWGLYAGALIDRYDRKKIFLTINIVGLAVLTGVSIAGYSAGSLPWYLVALVFGTTALIYNIHFPNLYAFAQEITPKEQYSKVTSTLEIQGQITFTLAGAFAAMLLQGLDGTLEIFGSTISIPISFRAWQIHEIFAVNAVTYVIAYAIIYRIKSLPVVEKKTDTTSLRNRLQAGVDFLFQHPVIFNFGNASLMVFLTIIICSTYVLPPYVDKFLGKGANVYAMADMFFSFGALVAGILTNKIFGDKKAVRGIIMLTALAGIMYSFMMVNKVLFLFFAAQFVIGACNAAVRIQRVTYMFHHIPNHIIGRTGSIFFMMNVAFRLCLIGLFTLPFFHTGAQIQYAMAVFAVICFAAAIALWAQYGKLMQEPTTK